MVDKNRQYISVGRSLFRETILLVPFFVNGIIFPPCLQKITIISVFTLLFILVVFGGIAYFYIFNMITRQSLHDLICGTYVIKKSLDGMITVKPVEKIHYLIYGILILIALIYSIYQNNKKVSRTDYSEILALHEEMHKKGNVSYVYTNMGKSFGQKGYSGYMITTIALKDKPDSYDKELMTDKYVKIIFDNYPQANNKDIIGITIAYDANIGIARIKRYYPVTKTSNEWRNIIENNNSTFSHRS